MKARKRLLSVPTEDGIDKPVIIFFAEFYRFLVPTVGNHPDGSAAKSIGHCFLIIFIPQRPVIDNIFGDTVQFFLVANYVFVTIPLSNFCPVRIIDFVYSFGRFIFKIYNDFPQWYFVGATLCRPDIRRPI